MFNQTPTSISCFQSLYFLRNLFLCPVFFKQILYCERNIHISCDIFISGMTVHDFKGIPSLQEVECSGKTLSSGVVFTSITLFRKTDDGILVTLLFADGSCKTYTEFTSCTIVNDRKSSIVRTLISDWSEGDAMSIGCNVTGLSGRHGITPRLFSWSLTARRGRELYGS